MAESILNTIKKMLGIPVEDTAFDIDIISHINSTFTILHQLGVGPVIVFSILDHTTEWNAFSQDAYIVALCKSYMYSNVRLIFDPPTTSFHIEALNRQISEFQWRLYVYSDPITIL